ncbi:hypothetical protein PISMIDRAFT_680073 [Pisolithus microcarpus 441]|uniref:Uncharacterized protein n=1 Tax=Pisolithus microcarpus 441 TaxID=765257 RepID=A0A0C9ZJ63_9AGAM|nr:hypothetical protein PISMIDRAFT_680073 [Pisolithus microcarpus 441]
MSQATALQVASMDGDSAPIFSTIVSLWTFDSFLPSYTLLRWLVSGCPRRQSVYYRRASDLLVSESTPPTMAHPRS